MLGTRSIGTLYITSARESCTYLHQEHGSSLQQLSSAFIMNPSQIDVLVFAEHAKEDGD